MEGDSEDKQHKPTGKRLGELRKKGTVMRSKDLAGGLIYLFSITVLSFMSTRMSEQFQSNFIQAFGAIGSILSHPDQYFSVLKSVLYDNFMILIPILIVIAVAVFLSPLLFGGWNFTLEVINFNLGKLDPIANLMRIFSLKQAATEMVKSFIKSSLLMAILIIFVINKYNTLFSLSRMSLKSAMTVGYQIIFEFLAWLAVGVIVLATIDVIYNYFHFFSKNKMSTHEIKEEGKEAEGNVDVKRKIRSKQLALYKQKLMQVVPKANVIVTNPTHYAVALQYDENRDNAPKVLAKGKGLIAQQIRHIAIVNGVPIYEAPPLARSIYYTTKVGREVHPGLYMAVAIVLSYVYQLKNYQMGNGQLPKHVSDLEIPSELMYNE